MSSSTQSLSVAFDIRHRRGKNRKRLLAARNKPASSNQEPSLMATMMAMARHFDGLVTRGVFTSYVSIAHAHGLSLVHVNRIMSLCFLAPDIQEQLLFLQQECDGSDPVGWRDIIPLTREPNWTTQREHETGILLKALAARQQCH